MTTADAQPTQSTPVLAPPMEPPAQLKPPVEEIPVHNPATGEEIGRVPVMGASEVRAAVERARKAQKAWGALTVEQRCARLYPLKGIVLERADEIAAAITKENGKTIQEAHSMELTPVLELTKVYLKRAPKALAPRRIPINLVPNRASYLHYVPHGVVAVISPWNFPFSLPFGPALFALIAGNAVVIKPSEQTPLICQRIKDLFVEAGIDPDLIQIVTGRGATGTALIESGVGHVCFTGSVATGRKVGELCGRLLIPCTLELGGKAPAIICADADLERAAAALAWGAFSNHGQICASVERVYADERIYPELKERILKIVKALRQGDPTTDVDVGACTFPPQVEKIRALLTDAKDKGAVFETGGIPESGTRFVAPTVITGVDHGMRIMREESFGPIMPLMPVRGEQEAIEKANDSDLGLCAYVFTSDPEKGRQIAEKVEAGTVMINDVNSSFAMVETPWQGVKASGIGRTHSDDGLRDMCQCRHVNYDRFSIFRKELYWYPYSRKTVGLLKKLARLLYAESVADKLGALFKS